MARKIHEVSFHIAGKLANSFSSAFKSASAKAEQLQDNVKDLKRNLRELDQQYKRGEIAVDVYRKAHQRLSTELDRNISKQRELQRVQKETQRQNQMMSQSVGNTVASARAALAVPAAIGTTAAGYAAYNSTQKGMDFQAQLSSIKAVTGLGEKEMEKMRALSLKVGATTKYSALEAAQGIEELLKAGIGPAIVQSGGLESALNLATAGGLELSEASIIMSDALNGFKKDGMSAFDAANILAGAANASSTDLREMKYGLSSVGTVADGLGVSFKGVNATLALFSNNALKGSDAGTSLKTFLMNVQPDTEDATDAFKKFGLITKNGTNILFKSNGQLKDMSEVAQILNEKFKNLKDNQRSAVFETMFGSDAIRAANILYKEGADGINKMYDEMSKVTAMDVAAEKMNNASGAVEELKGAFETLQIIATEGTMPVIQKFASNMANSLEAGIPEVQRAGSKLGKALDEIMAPFEAPPEFNAERAKMNPGYLEAYQSQIDAYNKKFGYMDFGDRVVQSLDIMATKVDAWVEGEGGDQFEKVFTKLAEISINAWYKSVTGLLSNSAQQLGEGNVASAVGLGLLANVLTGGLLLKGGAFLGKKGIGKGADVVKGFFAKKGKGDTGVPNTKPDSQKENSNNKPSVKPQVDDAQSKTNSPKVEAGKKIIPFPKKETSMLAKTTSALGKLGNVAGKITMPLAIATSLFNIATAEDKTKATAQAAGGVGGAAIGAAIGTFLLPGIGTAIGGALGGLAGNWGAGKVTDVVKEKQSATATAAQQANTQQAEPPKSVSKKTSDELEKSSAALSTSMKAATKNFEMLTMYAGRISGELMGEISPLKKAIGSTSNNFSILTSYVGQASGWMASVYSIQSRVDDVKDALNRLVKRIDGVSISGKAAIQTDEPKKYKRGGILRTMHMGMVAEEGPESVIPVKRGDNRSLSLWQETGRLLGANRLIEKANHLPSSNSGNIHVVYSPIYHGVEKSEIEPLVEKDRNDFFSQMKQYQHQKKRVSLA